MKRVCTLRKVYRSLSKVLLEKLFYCSYISCGFLSPLSSYCFLSYLQPGDMLWNGKVTLNICMRKSFSQFYCHICHTHINLLVYNGLMVATDPISIITLLSPIATP